MSQSSYSPSFSSRRARDPAPPLPLIVCPRCSSARTVTFVSSTENNPGYRFYKCPNQGENGTCDFFLWDQHYAFFITGVGINLLIEAAGGGSSFMFGIGSCMRDMKSTMMNIFILCLIILAILSYQLANNVV